MVLRIGELVGLMDAMAIRSFMIDIYDSIVGATCATVRSTHAHKLYRLRLVRVWHLFVASSLKRLDPRGIPGCSAQTWPKIV